MSCSLTEAVGLPISTSKFKNVGLKKTPTQSYLEYPSLPIKVQRKPFLKNMSSLNFCLGKFLSFSDEK